MLAAGNASVSVTLALMLTESCSCINGYRNSCTLIGLPALCRFSNVSRSSLRATRIWLAGRILPQQSPTTIMLQLSRYLWSGDGGVFGSLAF